MDKIKLPKGITEANLQDNWNMAYSMYLPAFRRMILLDATDRGRLWDAIGAKFPGYQILPNTNHVAFIKRNLVASIYSVGKAASLLPTTAEDKEIVEQLNIALSHYWGLADITRLQMQAGERAALLNLGITQVGWDSNLSGGTGSAMYKGGPALKNIDPSKFMRDPYSASLDTASYCMTWDILHISVLKQNPLYSARITEYEANPNVANVTPTVDLSLDRPANSTAQSQKGYCKLIVHWVRKDGAIHEIHTIDNSFILYVRENIKPAVFPFAMLYFNEPAGDLIGTSEPAKIFADSVAYNLTNSIILTAEYKNQRPPKFINGSSGLNVASFIKHGNEADYTFIVNGDAEQAVHYHTFPQPSVNATNIANSLAANIQAITGVDGRYTGRDTGSILTTGGIESMLDQVTMIDAPTVKNYESYTKRLTQLILSNLLEFSPSRKYFVKKPNTMQYATVEVDFPKIDAATMFEYDINISSELPKNKARLAQMANTLMEKQMQYSQAGQKVDFITPEEWLMCQDIPIREFMMERMGIQRTSDYTEKVSEILFTFAELTKQGMAPDEAIAATAAQLQANEQPLNQPDIPQVVQGATMQENQTNMGY